jgi:hypothetical protein
MKSVETTEELACLSTERVGNASKTTTTTTRQFTKGM